MTRVQPAHVAIDLGAAGMAAVKPTPEPERSVTWGVDTFVIANDWHEDVRRTG